MILWPWMQQSLQKRADRHLCYVSELNPRNSLNEIQDFYLQLNATWVRFYTTIIFVPVYGNKLILFSVKH